MQQVGAEHEGGPGPTREHDLGAGQVELARPSLQIRATVTSRDHRRPPVVADEVTEGDDGGHRPALADRRDREIVGMERLGAEARLRTAEGHVGRERDGAK
jgi:hypothetical protein